MLARGLDDLRLEELSILADEELDHEPAADLTRMWLAGETPVRVDALPHLLHVVAIVRIGRVERHRLSNHAALAALVVAAASTALDRRVEGGRGPRHGGEARLAAHRGRPQRR